MNRNRLVILSGAGRARCALRGRQPGQTTRVFAAESWPAAFPRTGFSLTALLLTALTGCHSAFVDTTITNLGPPVTVFEMDYPSQSFGTSLLATGQAFHYRFKVQGSGAVKVQYNDAKGKPHSATGPVLQEGAEGTLTVSIDRDGRVEWRPKLTVQRR